jgi:chromosome segregation ATPase
MFFTVGNLLTLGIVALALLLYRFLDKGSRSLDKVRKYTDKCKEEIAVYAEEKGTAIKDFGITLEVERKSAAELMRRIKVLTEEELAHKAQALTQIDERIRAYDTSLEELVKMTGRVQENLNRIRDESAFVENTGKRVTEAREKFERIEKDIGLMEKKLNAVELRFERENAAALEEAIKTAVSSAKSTVADFEAGAEIIERKVEDHREAVNKIEHEREASLARDIELINKTFKDALEKAAARADKLEDAALLKLRDQAQERINQIRTSLEEKVKSVQETVKTRLGEIQEQLKSNRDEWKAETAAVELRQKTYRDEWKKDVQELNAFAKQQRAAVTQQQQEFNTSSKQQRDESNAALAQHQHEWKKSIQEINTGIVEQRERWNKEIKDLAAAIKKQKEDWASVSQEAEEGIIAASEARLAEYRQAQDEQFRQLAKIADDAARLESELRRSMQEAAGRVNADFARFEEESRRARENAALEFGDQVHALKAELDGVDQNLAALKAKAFENVSEKLKVFEDDFFAGLGKRSAEIDRQLTVWYESLDKRLVDIAEAGEAERQKAEVRITEELRKNLAAQGEKLVSELERLKTETSAFEEGIREEMRGVDESRKSFSEQLGRDMEETRNAAENELKTQIGEYSLSVSETLRQSQRDLETRIRELAAGSKEHISALEAAAEESRKGIEEWQGQYSARIRELDESMEETRRRNRELAAENDERIAAARSALEDMRREMTAQSRLFDRTNELKIELDRYIEDINGDIARLDQRKNEIAQIESQFTLITRLGDDVNAKMTRFLSEKRRIEVMENDFNRLLQTSQAVEEKLAQVSSSDDTLQAIQVQLRRIEDAVKDAEEKYQRIERKSQTMEETNNGIDRNFKALQESEAALKKTDEAIDRLGKEANTIRSSIEALAAENDKARDAAEKLSALDESLAHIEKRIAEMNVAREWLARTETELAALDKDAQTQLRLTRSLLNREGGKTAGRDAKGKPAEDGAPPPRDRDNIIKLRRQGWTVEEIANTMDISKGMVELVLEFGPKKT